jgi:hypothetical protein
MYSFEKFYKIEEAISLKNVRKFNLKKSNGGAYYIDQINEIFGKKDRLIYDLDLSTEELINVNNPIIKKLLNFLNEKYLDYELKNKRDYITGVCFKKTDTERKQPNKIGKLLQKHINEEGVSDLLDSFKKDPTRSTKLKTSKVVISRHPYDIAGMSTDRSWRSCMTYAFKGINYPEGEVKAGINVRYVQNDIELGSIVAYLVSPEDVLPNGKIALKRPLSRILMKPNKNSENSNDYAYSLGRTYGASNLKFSDFVKNWLIENINKNTKGKTYLINSQLYDDSDETVNFKAIKQRSNLANRIFFEALENSTDPKYFNNFTVNTGEGNYGGVFLEFGINFKIPDNIKLPKFRYQNENLPKYLKEILNKINIKSRRGGRSFDYSGGRSFDYSLIESFEDTNTLVIEYTYNDPYFEGLLDEKGNQVPLDEDDLYNYWNEIINYNLRIQDINYLEIYKEVVDVLEKANPENEKQEELISIKNDFKKFVEEQPKGNRLNTLLSYYADNKINFDKAKKYFTSLGELSLDKFISVYKTKEYMDNIKIIDNYIQAYKNIYEAFMYYVPSKYSLIQTYSEWRLMIENHFNEQNLKINVSVLPIGEYIRQLRELFDSSIEDKKEIKNSFAEYREIIKF